ncbi:hypothetical protein LINPERPRIM_LOCUS321 [Linum perenne]
MLSTTITPPRVNQPPPATEPNDRPPEQISTAFAAFDMEIDSVSTKHPNPPTGPAVVPRPYSSAPRSCLGALEGPRSPTPSFKQVWIPVGEQDIVPQIKDGIRSLKLSQEFKEKLCKPWASTLVVRLLGRSIGYSYLCHRLRSMWKPISHMHIIDLDKGCFMVKFADEQDYFKDLTGGPWLILDHYLVVHQWSPDFRVSDSLPAKMNAERGKFARLAVEINLDELLAPLIDLDGHRQDIEYENLPDLCFECGKVGHLLEVCPITHPPSSTPPVDQQISPPQSSSERPAAASPNCFGPWMVVKRKSRRTNLVASQEKEGITPISGWERKSGGSISIGERN